MRSDPLSMARGPLLAGEPPHGDPLLEENPGVVERLPPIAVSGVRTRTVETERRRKGTDDRGSARLHD